MQRIVKRFGVLILKKWNRKEIQSLRQKLFLLIPKIKRD